MTDSAHLTSALAALGHAAANRTMAELTPQEAYDLLGAYNYIAAERDALRAVMDAVHAQNATETCKECAGTGRIKHPGFMKWCDCEAGAQDFRDRFDLQTPPCACGADAGVR